MSLFWLAKNWTERVTNGVKVTDSDHAYIHEGAAYEASWVDSVSGQVKFGFDVASTGGSDKYVHLRPAQIHTEKGTVTFQIFEGSTRASTGSVVPSYNRNRAHGAAEYRVTVGDASTSTGYTKIHEQQVYGGTGPGNGASGAVSGQPFEWVFKRNTKYVFRLASSEAIKTSVNFFWYEEGDG